MLLKLVAIAAAVLALLAALWMAEDGADVGVLHRALAAAGKGGRNGLAAAVVQTVSLMWLRTTMNYQMVKGSDFCTAVRALWRQGGVRRFYRGVWLALLVKPLITFGDVAMVEGAPVLLGALGVPSPLWAAGASAGAPVARSATAGGAA